MGVKYTTKPGCAVIQVLLCHLLGAGRVDLA